MRRPRGQKQHQHQQHMVGIPMASMLHIIRLSKLQRLEGKLFGRLNKLRRLEGSMIGRLSKLPQRGGKLAGHFSIPSTHPRPITLHRCMLTLATIRMRPMLSTRRQATAVATLVETGTA